MNTHSPMQKESNNIHQPNMKKICGVCGDFGIQEAIITCYQCKNVDVHQYCVVGYWEDAPVDWRCEECDICKGVMFSLHGLENERFKGPKSHASTKICQSTVQPKKHSKFPRRQHINWEKEVRTGKTRYLPVEEALGPGASTILKHRTRDVVNESCMMNSPLTHPCDPALVPSWKGRFDILGALELAPEIFQAHPPCRVSRKVYEFSGKLLDTLKLELVPRGDIWPSLFDNHCPSKEDIGLYFFESEKKRFEGYIALVEFMHNKDLVMRTLINDVELIILASTALCSDSQRWNNEHFLWGLFYRSRQDTNKCSEGGRRDI
uniref:PHD-finger family protein n=1 Tax=Solanum tuberosum TaxID=4113 RepID=M1CGW3_SOLTU